MDEIALDFAIDLSIEIQPTHTFDFNLQDALYHWAVKHGLRKQGFPKGDIDLQNKFQTAVNNISLDTIQRGFLWSYSRGKYGNEDKSLIPPSLLGWYDAQRYRAVNQLFHLNRLTIFTYLYAHSIWIHLKKYCDMQSQDFCVVWSKDEKIRILIFSQILKKIQVLIISSQNFSICIFGTTHHWIIIFGEHNPHSNTINTWKL